MGWCQAFGPQIREGCDHSMVAGVSSCSCPECGVVCKGKFPGCSAVWAAGPRQVTLRRPTKQIGSRTSSPVASPVGATNGARALDRPPDSASLPALTGQVARSGLDGDLRSLMEAVSADVRALRRQVDELHKVAVPSESLGEATLHALSMLENLPERIARAASEALRQQHELNLRDLKEQWGQLAAQTERLAARTERHPVDEARRPGDSREATQGGGRGGNVEIVARATEDGPQDRPLGLEDFRKEWRQFAADIERTLNVQMKYVAARSRAAEVEVASRALKEMASAAATDRATIMGHMDAQFGWLVNQLSDRLVTLGNALVRIEKRLGDQPNGAPVTNGHIQGRAQAPWE